MEKEENSEIDWPLSDGIVKIRFLKKEDEIKHLFFEGDFNKYPRYRPVISSKIGLIKAFNRQEAAIVAAIRNDKNIIGFGLLEPPFPDERWARLGKGSIYEVSLLEVSREWRSLGISKAMLQSLVNRKKLDDSIVYMVGYSWTWDLEGKGLDPMAYREMLINIFSGQDFERFQTNEPNVLLRPENLFMARIGKAVSEEMRRRFKLLRFDLDHLDQPDSGAPIQSKQGI
jgi:acetoin utilization protein AcuA